MRPKSLMLYLFVLTYLLWVSFPVFYLLDVSQYVKMMICTGAMVLSLFISVHNLLYGIYMVPLVALIGPIISLDIAGVATVTIADFYLMILTIVFVTRTISGKNIVFIGRYAHVFILFLTFLLLSYVFSNSIFHSTLAFINLSQLCIISLLSINVIRTRRDARRLLAFWVGAAIICSIMVCIKYFRNDPMLVRYENIYGVYDIEIMKEKAISFYRATYFYAGFGFILTISTIILLIDLLYSNHSKILFRLFRLFKLFLLMFLGFTMFIMNNKTGIFTFCIIGVIIIFPWSGIIGHRNRFNIYRVVVGVFAISLASLVVVSGVVLLISVDQIVAGIQRIEDQSSLSQRLEIFGNALDFLIHNPKALLVGIGPDIITRAGIEDVSVEILLLNRTYGLYEGAIDSSYVGAIVEYGLITVAVFLLIIYHIMKSLYKKYKKTGGIVYFT